MDEYSVGRPGFSDHNRADPLHDLVCEFLCEDEQRQALCKALNACGEEARTEVTLAKGDGHFRKVIGFLDVVYYHLEHSAARDKWIPRMQVIIEVKTHISSINEAIRQIKGYRVYVHDPDERIRWVLAVTKDAGLERQHEDTLIKAKITPVVLETFDDWCAKRTASPDYDTPKSVKL